MEYLGNQCEGVMSDQSGVQLDQRADSKAGQIHADAKADANDALRNEYLVAAAIKEDTGKANQPAIEPKAVDTKAAEERKAAEAKEFTDRFDKYNFKLDPPKPGQGPYQVLEQMEKDGKIDLTEDEIQSVAKHIRNRDFKAWGRNYYTTHDSTTRWTDPEIEKNVQDLVNKVKGIDVSSHQNNIDWQKVADAGYQFAFLKATEGVDWVDSTFAANREGARAAGLKVGYYHYFRPNDPVDDQVKNFVNTVGKVEPDALRLVIDAEEEKMWKPYSQAQRVKMITQWCDEVQKKLGVKPSVLVYSSPNFITDTLGSNPKLGKYDLWIANYHKPEPSVPKPWSNWTYWQYDEHGQVPGVTGEDVDLDVYNGTDLSNESKHRKRH